MEWESGLVIYGVKIYKIDSNDFVQNVQALYELSYKYDMIDMHKWESTDYRPAYLAIADAGVRQVGRTITYMLIMVFDDWLKAHALTDPQQWAEARMEEDEDDFPAAYGRSLRLPGTAQDILYGAMMEYNRWRWAIEDAKSVRRIGMWGEPQKWHQFYQELMRSAPKMKSLERIAGPIVNEMVYGDPDDDEPVSEIPWQDVFDYIDPQTFTTLLDVDDAYDFVKDVWAHVVFPQWFKWFKPQGIVSTRKKVERARKKLDDIKKNIGRYDMPKLIKDLNVVIHTAHHGGLMTDYIDRAIEEGKFRGEYRNRWGDQDTKTFLKAMSNLPSRVTKSWDTSLYALGMLPEVDMSRTKRRQLRAQAQDFVAAAWRELARKQKNPRTTLQRLVIKRLKGK